MVSIFTGRQYATHDRNNAGSTPLLTARNAFSMHAAFSNYLLVDTRYRMILARHLDRRRWVEKYVHCRHVVDQHQRSYTASRRPSTFLCPSRNASMDRAQPSPQHHPIITLSLDPRTRDARQTHDPTQQPTPLPATSHGPITNRTTQISFCPMSSRGRDLHATEPENPPFGRRIMEA